MKKNLFLSIIALLLFLVVGCSSKPSKTVALTQIVAHPSLDRVRAGVMNELVAYRSEHPEVDFKIIYENAQGNVATAMQIAQKLAGMHPDVIIAISTPSAQAAITATRKTNTPIVFAAVTDPVYAQLVTRLDNPEGRVTGATDAQPLNKQLALMRELVPHLKTLGVVYNPGEVNSVRMVEMLKQLSEGIIVLEASSQNSNEVPAAAQRLVQQVDALYVPLDNTVVSALDALLKVCNKHKVPVFSADPDLVSHGVLASEGVGYEEVGRLAGSQAVAILEGRDPGSITVSAPVNTILRINGERARALGIQVPEVILQQADIVGSLAEGGD